MRFGFYAPTDEVDYSEHRPLYTCENRRVAQGESATLTR